MNTKNLLTAAAATALIAGSTQATVVVDGWTVLDNAMAPDASGTFSTVGTFTQIATEPDDWDNNFLYANPGVDDAQATWTFNNLTNGTYEVAVSYTRHPNRASAAPYTIVGDTTYLVNQETVIASPVLLNDGSNDIPFEVLTTTATVASNQLVVQLDEVANSGSDYIIADAVAIRLVPEPGSLALLGLGGLLIGRRRRG